MPESTFASEPPERQNSSADFVSSRRGPSFGVFSLENVVCLTRAGLPKKRLPSSGAMAKAAIQTAAKSLNGMTLGSGLAIGGLALGLGGWQLGSAIDKATDHSYRALLAAEHWGARLDNIDVKEWGRRADEAAQTWKGAGAELRRQSDLWRETTEKAAEASYAIGALLLRLLDGVEVDCLISAQVACRRALELAAGARAARRRHG